MSDLLPADFHDATVDESPEKKETHIHLHLPRKHLYGYIAAIAGVAALLTYLLLAFTGLGDQFNSYGKNEIGGEVALTQSQLVDLLAKNEAVGYWVGPEENYLYALTITDDKQVFIKYLPGGKGLADESPIYRIVATYPESGAYDITRAAGTQSNAVAFVNEDGAAVYYSKEQATNVYVAFSGVPSQIELFDPNATTALKLATVPGTVVLVK